MSKRLHWIIAIGVAAILAIHSIAHWWWPADYDIAIANRLRANGVAVESDEGILTYLSFLAGAYGFFWLALVAPRLVGLLYVLFFGLLALASIAMSGVSLYFFVNRDGPVGMFVVTAVMAVVFVGATVGAWKQVRTWEQL